MRYLLVFKSFERFHFYIRVAEKWMNPILEKIPNIELTLLIGQYAQGWYLKAHKKATLTETVKNWQKYQPKYFVLPHPSPRIFLVSFYDLRI